MSQTFNTAIKDSQESIVLPVLPEHFDFDAYAAYEASMLERNRDFRNGSEGLLIYRRVRGSGVFYEKCRDYRESLSLQLGALKSSMQYRADIANFLEPWYGIGYIAAAFGGSYHFEDNQAPAVKPMFSSIEEVLRAESIPICDTKIGKRILEMEEYFLDQTKGRLPMSFCDVQSPLNMLSYLVPVQQLFYDMADEPERVGEAAKLVAELLLPFLQKQKELIGDLLALPGHGFASSRAFQGIGMSDDNAIMIRPQEYREIFMPADLLIGRRYRGLAFHSCGNYERQIEMVLGIPGVTQADGAFSMQTDPSPNQMEPFSGKFAGSGVILNARAVGGAQETIRALEPGICKGMKLIAVTYCDKEEQQTVYESLHRRAEEVYQ